MHTSEPIPVITHPPSDTDQLKLWRSEFGSAYTSRNDRELPARVEAFRQMLAGVPIKRALEVGCNVGWNLTYLQALGINAYGIEPQAGAVAEAHQRGLSQVTQGSAFALPFADNSFDLVFTAGVLIHISPQDLPHAMNEIFRVSKRYVLYVEYDADYEEEIPYRGHTHALWRRDHRAAYARNLPRLRLLRAGHWGWEYGFDCCGWGLFEKPGR